MAYKFIVERQPHEKGKGDELCQFLAGASGSMLTTLPAFIIIFVWWGFVTHYKIVDAEGKEDDFLCGVICFFAGMLIWVLAILISWGL